jgi:hypothetical protein
MTCWRRIKAWQRARVRNRLHRVRLSKLRGADKLDFFRVVADSFSYAPWVRGKKRTERKSGIMNASQRKSLRHTSESRTSLDP